MTGFEREPRPCPFCGHPKARLMHKTQYRKSQHGYVAYEWVPEYLPGYGGREIEVNVQDYRHTFYVRCNKCNARGSTATTEWHVTTKEEAECWSRYQPTFGNEWDSDFAKEAREKAVEAWNARAGVE